MKMKTTEDAPLQLQWDGLYHRWKQKIQETSKFEKCGKYQNIFIRAAVTRVLNGHFFSAKFENHALGIGPEIRISNYWEFKTFL